MLKTALRFTGTALLLLTATTVFTSYCKAKKNILVRGTVSYLQPYCGGAAPTPEMVARQNILQPSRAFILHFKKGSRNSGGSKIIQTVTTNETGYFEVRLPKGEYCVVEDYKSKPFVIPADKQFTVWDTTCLKKAYESCDYQLKVIAANKDTIKLIYRNTCFYSPKCGSYNGPMPPSSQPPRPPKGE